MLSSNFLVLALKETLRNAKRTCVAEIYTRENHKFALLHSFQCPSIHFEIFQLYAKRTILFQCTVHNSLLFFFFPLNVFTHSP